MNRQNHAEMTNAETQDMQHAIQQHQTQPAIAEGDEGYSADDYHRNSLDEEYEKHQKLNQVEENDHDDQKNPDIQIKNENGIFHNIYPIWKRISVLVLQIMNQVLTIMSSYFSTIALTVYTNPSLRFRSRVSGSHFFVCPLMILVTVAIISWIYTSIKVIWNI